MMKLHERADALGAWMRRGLLAAVTSEGLFLALMMVFNGVLNTDVFMTGNHLIDPLRQYVIMPWSGAMLGLYLAREKRNAGLDVWMLALLVLWLIVPFVLRFGAEYFTMSSAFGYALCFFVLYASVRESDAQRRAHQLDIACAGACLISVVLGSVLLYCAATGRVFFSYWDTHYFGVVKGQLQHGAHYNTTGMMALVCTMMCFIGLCRSRRKPWAVVYLLGAGVMALVVVLTQSRTARYAMLLALAMGAWNAALAYLPVKKNWLRRAAALVCAAAVIAGGYALCAKITDAALAHYAGASSPVSRAIVPSARADHAAQADGGETLKAREAVDSTFSDRTSIWKNVFINWKNNPKHMLIGNGAGRTRWLVAKNTIHESAGQADVHNAYLHFAAEYGWIGFGMLVMFVISIAPDMLRVFLARGEKRMKGSCALGALVVAVLATGMMESSPLVGMTPMNMALFFALAQLAGAGRDMRNQN